MISFSAGIIFSLAVLVMAAVHFLTAGKKLQKLNLFLRGEIKKSLFGSSFSGMHENFGYKIYFTSKSEEGQQHDLTIELHKPFDFRAEVRKNNFVNRTFGKLSFSFREVPTGNPLYDGAFLLKLEEETKLARLLPSAENIYRIMTYGWSAVSISEKGIKAVKRTSNIEDELVAGIILPVIEELSSICSKS